jgi:Fe-S cluster assembly protein SufD
VVPNTTSNQLYKGIYAGKSTGVFNGKILVDQIAQKTNAYQSGRNILLSPDSKVYAKPQLEIFADDVKCSHGATIGQLDEEPLFYLRSRGLDLATARLLLVRAFASEILMQINSDSLRTYAEEKAISQLDEMTKS